MKLAWLGQAGFRLTAADGTVVLIDPYLSDSLRRDKGEDYTRQVPIDQQALTGRADVLALTHIHQDHTDMDTLDALIAANGHMAVLAPGNVLLALRQRYGRAVDCMLFESGVEVSLSGLLFRATYAAHSDVSPIGVTVEGDGVTLCHTGDTMYHRRLLQELPRGADALLLPINGSGYNMNAVDALRLTLALAPKRVLPMHWDMFRAYGCDVGDFAARLPADGPALWLPPYYTDQIL